MQFSFNCSVCGSTTHVDLLLLQDITCSCASVYNVAAITQQWLALPLMSSGVVNTDEIPTSVLYYYNARILDVIDGDTFYAEVDLGFQTKGFHKFRMAALKESSLDSTRGISMSYFDTAETTWRASNEAEVAHGMLAKTMLEKMTLNKDVILITRKAGKYGRWLADIIIGGTVEQPEMITTLMKNLGLEKLDSYESYDNKVGNS